MNKIFFFIIIFGVMMFVGPAAVAQNGVLKIEILGLTSDQGMVMIAVYSSPETYMDASKIFRRAKQPIAHRTCQWVVDDLPPGRYVISVFHDLNDNSKLDTGLFGIPKEPYGFSNNARGKFGPPDWESVAFDFQLPEKAIVVKVE
jgi:uncharacterized protein (DUF2141 family)